MAGFGPPPDPNAVRRNKEAERTKLVASATPVGPELPAGVLPDGEDWHAVTKQWWEDWRTSPQAARMLSKPDWGYLLDTALLHHQMWISGGKNSERAAEIRLRVAEFGATPAARLRLKAEISTPEPMKAGGVVETGNVTDLDARRQRLLGS